MRFWIVSLFDNIYKPFLSSSLINRACESGQIQFELINLLQFCAPKQRVDAPAFGHGAGMLIKPLAVQSAIEHIEQKCNTKTFKIFFSPKGKKLDQTVLMDIKTKIQDYNEIILLPARYEGMDARVEEYYADEIISIGDYVLMGGDLPAMVFLESILRLFKGIVGKESSVENDSFYGAFVDYPSYTEPVEWQGMKVPDVLRSGNHQQVDLFRKQLAAQDTILHHFQWFKNHVKNEEDIKIAKQYIPNHYVVLMHNEVLLPDGSTGTSSVTSLDIHDIARSACTYNIKNYFLVTNLIDQQMIVNTLLSFWNGEKGVAYNVHRHEAISKVILVNTIDDAINKITEIEGLPPILISTSAQEVALSKQISFFDQSKIFAQQRPVLLIFGTSHGLANSILEKSDYVLLPVKGLSKFNHLSVRSAAAIILDRWLGINLKT